MRIISKARLRAFWGTPDCGDSEGPLRAWHMHISNKSAGWQSRGDVKTSFATVSLVGNCVVFNIGGNKYLLITRILFPSQKMFILKVLTHAEYDRNQWKEDCGCFEPPPPKAVRSIKLPPAKRRKREK